MYTAKQCPMTSGHFPCCIPYGTPKTSKGKSFRDKTTQDKTSQIQNVPDTKRPKYKTSQALQYNVQSLKTNYLQHVPNTKWHSYKTTKNIPRYNTAQASKRLDYKMCPTTTRSKPRDWTPNALDYETIFVSNNNTICTLVVKVFNFLKIYSYVHDLSGAMAINSST